MRKTLPPTFFIIAIGLAVALHLLLPITQILGMPWRILGLLPVAAGFYLLLKANRAFERHDTTVKPFETSSTLVTDGVFRISRNPMYLGLVLVLFGIALLLGTLSPFLALIGFTVLLDRRFVSVEERMLEETFGEGFRAYRQRVRRWI